MAKFELFIDGASRNNPGPAGAGIYLLKDNICILEKGFYLGSKTNNQAEYIALIIGLDLSLQLIKPELNNNILNIFSDSLLLVNQIKGIYKVKNPDLILLYQKSKNLLSACQYQITHVLREKNKFADKLANYGIDNKTCIRHV